MTAIHIDWFLKTYPGEFPHALFEVWMKNHKLPSLTGMRTSAEMASSINYHHSRIAGQVELAARNWTLALVTAIGSAIATMLLGSLMQHAYGLIYLAILAVIVLVIVLNYYRRPIVHMQRQIDDLNTLGKHLGEFRELWAKFQDQGSGYTQTLPLKELSKKRFHSDLQALDAIQLTILIEGVMTEIAKEILRIENVNVDSVQKMKLGFESPHEILIGQMRDITAISQKLGIGVLGWEIYFAAAKNGQPNSEHLHRRPPSQ